MERMPNLIPVVQQGDGGKTSQIKEDVMSPQLRAQFRALQHLHCNQQRKRSRIVSGEGNGARASREGNVISTYTEDSDNETLSTDQNDSNSSQPSLDMSNDSHDDINIRSSNACAQDKDSLSLQMAISTAISAQNEIDTLLKGIAELESMVNQQGSYSGNDDSNKSDITGESQMKGTEETSLVTIID